MSTAWQSCLARTSVISGSHAQSVYRRDRLVLGAIAVAWAAQPLGTISGVITDTTGRGVPGVTIAVVSENSERRMMGTDSVGRYRLDGLMPGRYTVDASMDGFDTKRTEIPISSERDVV